MMQSIQRNILAALMAMCALVPAASASNTRGGEEVDTVYVLFKTHLDVGFTDLSSVVEKQYVEEFIPKAIDVAEQLRADGSDDRYVWTTGSWLVWKYLRSADPAEVERLEKAIGRGDIVWNGVPYTVETETMTADLLDATLGITARLDRKYGKHTIAAKMTDVPGHTRSIIAPLNRAGIRFLHIGVNPACPIPEVPAFCRWRDPEGNEVILVYQQDYGSTDLLPGGRKALSVNFTGDNHGPHTYADVKKIYSRLREQYPNARLVPASFNEVASELLKHSDELPVVTSEIGDTWIYGYGSAPRRMAKFRAVTSLFSKWLREKKLEPDSDMTLDFAVELGLVAEHTQGMDIKTHLRNWDKYDMDKFMMARDSVAFRRVEQSWEEIDRYIYDAVDLLPEDLRREALDSLASIDRVEATALPASARLDAPVPFSMPLLGGNLMLGGLTYQMLDSKDYDSYLDRYLRARYDWALYDLSKIGLDRSSAVSANVAARATGRVESRDTNGVRTVTELAFAPHDGVDPRVYPERMVIESLDYAGGRKADVTLTIVNKPAVRLPEAYWLSFNANDLVSVIAEKTGARVDLLDVVEKGNRQMHGIDHYVDLITTAGTIRIYSDAAFLVNVGRPCGLDYSVLKPDISGGIHFNLSNNLWNTNFSMWNDGSLTYRFTIELL